MPRTGDLLTILENTSIAYFWFVAGSRGGSDTEGEEPHEIQWQRQSQLAVKPSLQYASAYLPTGRA